MEKKSCCWCHLITITLFLLLTIYIAEAHVKLDDDDDDDEMTICNNIFCECLDHNTNSSYIKGSINVTVDVYCSCANSGTNQLSLMSPIPLPHNTNLMHISECEVTFSPINETFGPRAHYFVITDSPKVTLREGAALCGDNIFIYNVDHMPRLPAHSLTCASFTSTALHKFILHNVNIDVIEHDALVQVHVYETFEMSNVNVKHIEQGALSVTLLGAEGDFLITNSTILNLTHSAIEVSAPKITFTESTFGFVAPHGLKFIAEFFIMGGCSVIHEVKSKAFDVQARVVGFFHNFFYYMDTHALFAVRKAENVFLPVHNKPVKWIYTFFNNTIVHAEPGSLNANWGLSIDDVIFGNKFSVCSCNQIFWFWGAKYQTENIPIVGNFYKLLFKPESENICQSDECTVHVSDVADAVNPELKSSVCYENATFSDMCRIFEDSSKSSSASYKFIISYLVILIISVIF